MTRRNDDKAWSVQHDKHAGKVTVFIFGSTVIPQLVLFEERT